MRIFAESERIILREILPSDEYGMFALESDLEVHRFLDKNPIHHISQAKEIISHIRQQYLEFGIGRWAIIEKETNEFVGWSGLKWINETINNQIHFYDLGYRLIQKHWGKGFATESANLSLDYGFREMKLDTIYGMADLDNKGSNQVLIKTGFVFHETFYLDKVLHNWYSIKSKQAPV